MVLNFTDLRFCQFCFCNSKKNPEIKDANKISHELKHTKFNNRKENSDHRKKIICTCMYVKTLSVVHVSCGSLRKSYIVHMYVVISQVLFTHVGLSKSESCSVWPPLY